MVIEEGRVLILGVNKWDTVENGPARRKYLEEELSHLLPQVKSLPLVTLSGLTGKNVDRLLEVAFKLFDVWGKRVSTSALNRWFEHASAKNPPPAVSGRRVRLNYATQVATRPPTFAVFGSRPQAVPESYKRYLMNSLSDAFDLKSIPVRLLMRGKGANPYAKKASKRG
jgi:GTP-binding protein